MSLLKLGRLRGVAAPGSALQASRPDQSCVNIPSGPRSRASRRNFVVSSPKDAAGVTEQGYRYYCTTTERSPKAHGFRKRAPLMEWRRVDQAIRETEERTYSISAGINKIKVDYPKNSLTDDNELDEPVAESWWHRPEWYRSPVSFAADPVRLKEFYHYMGEVVTFRDGSYSRWQVLNQIKSRLDQLRYLGWNKTDTPDGLFKLTEQIREFDERNWRTPREGPNKKFQSQRIERFYQSVEVMMQEVERAFWRENPPLPDYAAPLAGAEPDPAMNSDPRLLQDRFNDKQMGSSAVERMLEEIARHPGIGIYLRHPGLLLQGRTAGAMFDELLKTAIELRERERNERVEIGSINRAFMDVVYRYIPGWNHATHGFDLGKRNGVARTTMEEDEIKARVLNPGRTTAVRAIGEQLFQRLATPHPYWSQFYDIPAEVVAEVAVNPATNKYTNEELLAMMPERWRKDHERRLAKHWGYVDQPDVAFSEEADLPASVVEVLSIPANVNMAAEEFFDLHARSLSDGKPARVKVAQNLDERRTAFDQERRGKASASTFGATIDHLTADAKRDLGQFKFFEQSWWTLFTTIFKFASNTSKITPSRFSEVYAEQRQFHAETDQENAARWKHFAAYLTRMHSDATARKAPRPKGATPSAPSHKTSHSGTAPGSMTKTSKRDLHIDLWEEFKAVGLQRNFDPRPFGYYSWKEPNVLKKHKEVWRTEPENDIDLRKYQGGTLRLSGPYELFRQSGADGVTIRNPIRDWDNYAKATSNEYSWHLHRKFSAENRANLVGGLHPTADRVPGTKWLQEQWEKFKAWDKARASYKFRTRPNTRARTAPDIIRKRFAFELPNFDYGHMVFEPAYEDVPYSKIWLYTKLRRLRAFDFLADEMEARLELTKKRILKPSGGPYLRISETYPSNRERLMEDIWKRKASEIYASTHNLNWAEVPMEFIMRVRILMQWDLMPQTVLPHEFIEFLILDLAEDHGQLENIKFNPRQELLLNAQAPDVLTKDEQETVVRLLDTEARSGGDPFKMLIMGPLDPIPEVEAAYAREGYVMEYLDLDAPVIPGLDEAQAAEAAARAAAEADGHEYTEGGGPAGAAAGGAGGAAATNAAPAAAEGDVAQPPPATEQTPVKRAPRIYEAKPKQPPSFTEPTEEPVAIISTGSDGAEGGGGLVVTQKKRTEEEGGLVTTSPGAEGFSIASFMGAHRNQMVSADEDGSSRGEIAQVLKRPPSHQSRAAKLLTFLTGSSGNSTDVLAYFRRFMPMSNLATIQLWGRKLVSQIPTALLRGNLNGIRLWTHELVYYRMLAWVVQWRRQRQARVFHHCKVVKQMRPRTKSYAVKEGLPFITFSISIVCMLKVPPKKEFAQIKKLREDALSGHFLKFEHPELTKEQKAAAQATTKAKKRFPKKYMKLKKFLNSRTGKTLATEYQEPFRFPGAVPGIELSKDMILSSIPPIYLNPELMLSLYKSTIKRVRATAVVSWNLENIQGATIMGWNWSLR